MVVIVDYGVGNLASIHNMLKKAGQESVISGRAADIAGASKLLLPGMGHFDNCMRRLNDSGLRPLIEHRVFNDKVPILGICVGLQMLMNSSEEGSELGLGWIEGRTVKFSQTQMKQPLKVPNMGWLEVNKVKSSCILNELFEPRFYFAHSFHVAPDRNEDVLLTAQYGYEFTAGLQRENVFGVQFHPEKSHRYGMQLLKNFAANS